MTWEEISEMVEGMAEQIGCPWTHYQFHEDKTPPFLVFYMPERDDFVADSRNYQPVTELVIEFYADDVNLNAEKIIEEVLNTTGIPFVAQRQYIESERLWMSAYDMEVLLNG